MATALTATERRSARVGDTEAVSRPSGVKTWLWAFLVLGLGWRLLRYGLQFPIWGDEAHMCLVFIDQSYLGFLEGTKTAIVAPILYLWAELAAFQLLGGSELSLRLVPVLAG